MGLTLTLLAIAIYWLRKLAIENWRQRKLEEFEKAYKKEQEEEKLNYPAQLRTLTDEQFWKKLNEREEAIKQRNQQEICN
jgi:hypothetical protein